MSAYGQVWERIRAIRVELGRVCRGGAIGTLEEARGRVEKHKRGLDGLLREWERLELSEG